MHNRAQRMGAVAAVLVAVIAPAFGGGSSWAAGAGRSGPVTAGPGAAPGGVRVSMKEFAFSPTTVTVHAGDTVTWTYDESAGDPAPNCESPLVQPPSPVDCPGHSTTAAATGAGGVPLWDSGVHRASGFPYSVKFLAPGTYQYFCTVHGGPHPNNPVTHMNGTVVVLAAAGATGNVTGTAPAAAPPATGAPAVATAPSGAPAGGGGAAQAGGASVPSAQLANTGGSRPVAVAAAVVMVLLALLLLRTSRLPAGDPPPAPGRLRP